jgi:hypothetical protein
MGFSQEEKPRADIKVKMNKEKTAGGGSRGVTLTNVYLTE